jgi:hypothetical protein
MAEGFWQLEGQREEKNLQSLLNLNLKDKSNSNILFKGVFEQGTFFIRHILEGIICNFTHLKTNMK